jgi:hypothetical protein
LVDDNHAKNTNAGYHHQVIQQPWGQRVLHLYDPDGYILEIGEPFHVKVWWFSEQGGTIPWIAQKTGLPEREFETSSANEISNRSAVPDHYAYPP